MNATQRKSEEPWHLLASQEDFEYVRYENLLWCGRLSPKDFFSEKKRWAQMTKDRRAHKLPCSPMPWK